MSVKELRNERLQIHTQAVSVLQKRNFNNEDQATFDRMMSKVDSLTKEIAAAEANPNNQRSGFEMPDVGHKRSAAFDKWVRRGDGAISEAEKRSLEYRDVAEGDVTAHLGTYSGLGYLVPTGFSGMIEDATKYFAPLIDGTVFKLWQTGSGNPIPYPISNDTTEEAVIVAEAGTINENDLTASQISFGAYKLSSGVIKASIELLQDSGIDVQAWLAERFAIRYGRGLENYLTNGTGTNQPTGLLTAIANSGATPVIAAGSSANDGSNATGANSIGYADLVNLEHSVDPTYRRRASYMFHDQTLAALRKLLDKFGRPLWAAGISASDPDTINGYPYCINQQMPQIGSSNVTVAFGDMTKFLVRKVSGFAVQRLTELYAVNGQVGFISNMRVDSNLLDSGTHPINVLMQHS